MVEPSNRLSAEELDAIEDRVAGGWPLRPELAAPVVADLRASRADVEELHEALRSLVDAFAPEVETRTAEQADRLVTVLNAARAVLRENRETE